MPASCGFFMQRYIFFCIIHIKSLRYKVEYKFDKAREAISRGQHDRASLIISELEKDLPSKVPTSTRFQLLSGKYNAPALHESEKLYTHDIIKNLMNKAA